MAACTGRPRIAHLCNPWSSYHCSVPNIRYWSMICDVLRPCDCHCSVTTAAVRKVITVTEYPMTYNEPDHCSPTSRTPSKRSLLDIISRESGHPDDPHSLESTPNPSLVRSAGNSRNTRSSLTGYQWAGENPTTASAAIQSSGHSSQINADHSSVSSTDPCRSRSMDLPRQQASAVAGAQPGTSVGAARSRRHSVQFPATADYFGRLHEQPVSSSQTTTVPSEAEQGQISKLLNGRSRRGSLLGFPSTTAVAEAADAASMDHYRSGVTSMAPRRSRSLEVTATQRDGSASVSPALASPTTLPAARSFGHGRSSSRMPQVCTASALSSVGAPGASVEAAVPLSPAARGTAATAVLKGYGHQSSACNRPAFGAGQINGDNNAQAVRKNLVDVDAGPEFKPFVPSIEQLDQRALDHPAESDCTHYNVFLTSSVRH